MEVCKFRIFKEVDNRLTVPSQIAHYATANVVESVWGKLATVYCSEGRVTHNYSQMFNIAPGFIEIQ